MCSQLNKSIEINAALPPPNEFPHIPWDLLGKDLLLYKLESCFKLNLMKIQNDFYSLTPYSNLLIIEVFSAWDERVIEAYYGDIKRIAKKLYQDKPWAILQDRRGWDLLTPAAEQMTKIQLQSKPETPLSHLAIIVDNSLLKNWQIENTIRDATAFEIKVFNDPQLAKEWLKSLGYHMSPLEYDHPV